MLARRRLAAATLGSAIALSVATPAHALVVAQVTQHGYILVDEPNSPAPYGGSVGAANTNNFINGLDDIMATLDAYGAPHADFVAILQQSYEQQVVAFYLRIRNQTRGIGEHNPQGGSSEVYDLNPQIGTAFPIDGALFLNSLNFYSGQFSDYGNRIICGQEFAHRFMAEVHVPPHPGMPMPDPFEDAGVPDATVDPDAPTDPEAGTNDATVTPPDAGPALPSTLLLGRDLAHWSYFMNTGGSPMEGNAWEEIADGDFRTTTSTLTFSPLELYLMGLLPASSVPPFWVINTPDVMGQMDTNGNPIVPASPPEGFTFPRPAVEIRGQRVTFTIDDIVRANGPRFPAYQPADASVPADAGSEYRVREMNVIWVLLTTSDMLTPGTPAKFDSAIESCSTGYATATTGLGTLVPVSLPPTVVDAGTDAGVDATDVTAADARDAGRADAFMPPAVDVRGGCSCRVAGAPAPGGHQGAGAMGALFAVSVVASRRRCRDRA